MSTQSPMPGDVPFNDVPFDSHFRTTPNFPPVAFEPVDSEAQPIDSLAQTATGLFMIIATLILLAISPVLVLFAWEHLL